MARPRISLCMIVKDESKMIDACLASVKGFVSEMIVVDTGSTDDTRERAHRAGAKVIDSPWQNDFSQARNVSLAHAKGDWVLILDADERLVVTHPDRVRLLLEHGAFDCALLRLRDATSLTATHEEVLSGKESQGDAQRVPRLIRKDKNLRYVGVIHEDLAPWLVKYKKRIATLDLDIVHYGATREVYVDKNKLARNCALLVDLAARSPENPTPLGYLAFQYIAAERFTEAKQAVEEGWSRLPFVEALTGYRPSILRLAVARVELMLKAGDARGAVATAQRARALEGEHYDLDFMEGQGLEAVAVGERDSGAKARLLRTARACFETCIASAKTVYSQAFIQGANGWAAWTRLGSIALSLGEFDAAHDAFQTSLGMRPQGVEAKLGLLESTLHAHGGKAALAKVSALLTDDDVRATYDFWVLAAAACEAVGAVDEMANFLTQARSKTLKYAVNARRVFHAERVAALAMYRGAPVAGPGLVGTIGAVAARKNVALEVIGAWPSSLPVVRTLVANLAVAGQAALLEPLFEPRADVLVPGLTEHVATAARELGLGLVYEAPPSDIVVAGEDADFVKDMLTTHPRLVGRVRLAGEGDVAKPARVVDAGTGKPWPSVVARVSRRALFEDPVGQADLLLAALGEGDARPLVRYLVEAYPS